MPALRPVPTTQPKAIGYIRRSAKGEETITYEVQETSIRDYCASRGYTLVDIVKDPGISGLKWEKRKGIQEVLKRVESGEASKVVIWRWSRISRNRLHQAIALDRFEKVGAELESSTEPFDTTTAGGEFGRDVMLAAAAFESRQKREQWRDAHERRRRNGLPHNGTPRPGYTYVDGQYEVNEEEAPYWREAYERHVRGEGFPTILKYLDSHGVRSPRTGARFVITVLMRAMDSGFMAGKIIKDYKSATPTYLPGKHESLIDDNLWEAYLASRRSRRGHSHDVSPKYRVSGLVRCGDCGAAMVAGIGRNGVRGYVFECGKWRRGEQGRYVSSVRSAIEKAVLEWLKEEVDTEVDASSDAQPHKRAQVASNAEKGSIARKINDLDRQLATLTRQLASGLVPESAYRATRDEILDEKSALQGSLDSLVVQTHAPVDVAQVALKLVADWDVLPVQECRRMLAKLIRHVEVVPADKKWGRPTFRIVPAWEPVDVSPID